MAGHPYYREYDRKRGNNPERIQARIEYAKTPEGKKAFYRSKLKQRCNHPYKYKATNMVNNFIRDGKLFREPCCVCGSNEKVHAHHDDYAKPLNVRWLCAAHHRQWHMENGEAKNGSTVNI